MMGSRRTYEKDEPPTSDNPLIQANSIAPNIQSVRSVSFQEGNVSAGYIESMPYAYTPFLSAPSWGNMYPMNQTITQGIPETSGNPFMNPNSFQNPQVNFNFNTANTDLPEAPLLPEWNIRCSPQYINQEHNAISAGGMNDGTGISNFENPWSSKNPNFGGDLQMNRQAGESKSGFFNRPQIDADFVHSPFHYRPRNTSPYHARDNVNFNTSQLGVQGKAEGSFLSLGIGCTKEAIPSSQEMSDKLKEAASAELKMARARKAMNQTLDTNFTGVHSPYHILQMQQNDMQHEISRHEDSNSYFPSSRNINHGNSNHHRAFEGNQGVRLGTLGGNSAQFPNSHQYGLNRVVAPESGKPSWTTSHTPSGKPSITSPSLGLGSSSTRQDYAGKYHTPAQAPGTDLPFPKRLGFQFTGRDSHSHSHSHSPQAAERVLASRGTSLQTTSTGQTQDVQIQLAKDPRGVASTTASTVGGLSQKSDFYARPYHKRSAVAPPPAPHWVQRQKMMTHPTIHQSMPIRFPTRPTIPLTTTHVHPSYSLPVAQSQTHLTHAVTAPLTASVTASVNPSIPCTSSFKPRIPVTTAPVVSHITWKDPDISPPGLTKYKCLLCKRDLSLTSEGAVYQPTAPPPVAVLPCGHTFHDQCLQKITPKDQAKDPPCIPCAIGEN